MNSTVSTILITVLPFIGVLLGRVIEKRKSKAEIEKLTAEANGQELDNVSKAVKIWRELAAHLEETVNELKQEVAMLRKENTELKFEIKQLKKSIDQQNNKSH